MHSTCSFHFESASYVRSQIANKLLSIENDTEEKIKNELSNGIKDYKNATAAQKNSIISNMTGKVSGLAQGLSSSILNKISHKHKKKQAQYRLTNREPHSHALNTQPHAPLPHTHTTSLTETSN